MVGWTCLIIFKMLVGAVHHMEIKCVVLKVNQSELWMNGYFGTVLFLSSVHHKVMQSVQQIIFLIKHVVLHDYVDQVHGYHVGWVTL